MNLNLDKNRLSVYETILKKVRKNVVNPDYLAVLEEIIIDTLNVLPVPKLIESDNLTRITGDLEDTKVVIDFNDMNKHLSIETMEQHKKNISDIMTVNKSVYVATSNELKCFVISDEMMQSCGASIINSREDSYDYINNDWVYHGTKVVKYSQEDGKETKVISQEQIFDNTKVQAKR